ncbi:hypothetical protein J2776_002785 [Paraburkholderia caledonica]|uniref:Uncharacterized protein n=1 Tax=Paraburkholderia caledonica TaxID=134536 RepID=A0ABU1KYN3_9BURK|nr:hypothetical protein [Paraburkholderia caledonica]
MGVNAVERKECRPVDARKVTASSSFYPDGFMQPTQ